MIEGLGRRASRINVIDILRQEGNWVQFAPDQVTPRTKVADHP